MFSNVGSFFSELFRFRKLVEKSYCYITDQYHFAIAITQCEPTITRCDCDCDCDSLLLQQMDYTGSNVSVDIVSLRQQN